MRTAALAVSLSAVLFLATYAGGARAQSDPCSAGCVPLADYEALQERFARLRLTAHIYERRAAMWERRYRRLVKRLRWDSRAAIRVTFGRYAGQALSVAWCESRWSTRARNGQFLGLFQMGTYARSRYGHSHTAIGQARAAHRYFVASGRTWGPWSCKP
jgi:hypothetical protein